MKLSQMEYFLAAAQELNFTAAARRLFISQPALSKQIVVLEQELGVRLFNRSSRRVTLTAAGLQLQQDLQQVLEQLEQAKQRAAAIGREEGLKLRIGCFEGAITDDFLPRVLERVEEALPGVQVTLTRNAFGENKRALHRGEIDLLLTLSCGEDYDEGYTTQKLVGRRGILAYSVKSPLAGKDPPEPADFASEPFLVIKQTESAELYRSSLEIAKEMGITDPKLREVENFATLSAYLEMGQGYTVLAEQAAERIPGLRACETGQCATHWVVAVWKKDHPMVKALDRCFAGFATANV